MRQRLGIAAALLRSPRLLLLDEPTSGLDPAGARAVAALVRELAADGVAVLLSSHQIGELERICTSFTFLRDGRVVWDGTAAELETQAPASAFELVTSDDAAALRIAAEHAGVRAQLAARGGIVLTVRPGALDRLRAGARRCARRGAAPRAARQPAGEHVLRADVRRAASSTSSTPTSSPTGCWPADDRDRLTGPDGRRRSAAQLERARRLRHRAAEAARAADDAAAGRAGVLGPFAFAVLLKVQSGAPADALFGAWVHTSGFAISLVVLGFAGNWGFPIDRRRAGRRPLLLRGPPRHLEDDPDALVQPRGRVRRQGARGRDRRCAWSRCCSPHRASSPAACSSVCTRSSISAGS